MVQYVTFLGTDARIVNRFVNAHGRNFYPRSVFPITPGLRNFPNVDFRVKIGGKGFAVITGVTINNVEVMHLVKLMLVGKRSKHLRYAGIKTATQ